MDSQDTPRASLLRAIAVTAELTGTELSKAAAAVFAGDLEAYPLDQVLGALKRCRLECRGRLTIADVVARLEDGRPGVEEAWAMMPRSEAETLVWTEEMAEAFGVARPLMQQGDAVAARMAFKETYTKLLTLAREAGTPVRWTPSLGHDKAGRHGPIAEAVVKGRLTPAHAALLLPPPEHSNVTLLGAPGTPMPEHVRKQFALAATKFTAIPGGNDGKSSTR